MGVIGMVKGPTGSGKSTSLLNLPRGCVEVFGVTGKRMPFRAPLPVRLNAGYREIYGALRRNDSKCYVIDDSTYLMQFDTAQPLRVASMCIRLPKHGPWQHLQHLHLLNREEHEHVQDV